MIKYRFADSPLAALLALGFTASALAVSTGPAVAAVETDAARALGQSLVEAVNGRRADRRNWGRDHIASERVRGSEIEKLDRLAIRLGELSLTGVTTGEDAIALAVSDNRGREGTIELLVDRDNPATVYALNVSGF